MASPSVLELLLFHRRETELFEHLVGRLSRDRHRMKWVMALWLWLESVGHHEFIRQISAYDDQVILEFVKEGNRCLDCLSGQQQRDEQAEELPMMNSLVIEQIDVRFFEYHREVAITGITRIFQKVCRIIFDDNIVDLVATDGLSIGREGMSQQDSTFTGRLITLLPALSPLPPPVHSSNLNPLAMPWSPESIAPQDQRSLFLTFSRGHPLSREEIKEFFSTRYGPCVETVMMERVRPETGRTAPMYGRIVFTRAEMIAAVLGGLETAKFNVNGKHLWARIYHSQHKPRMIRDGN